MKRYNETVRINGQIHFVAKDGTVRKSDKVKSEIKRHKRLANVRAHFPKGSSPPRKVKGQSRMRFEPVYKRDSAGRLRRNGKMAKDKVTHTGAEQRFLEVF